MKTIKIITSIILNIVILGNITVFAEENLVKCIGKKDYELYKCEVENVCLKEEYGKNAKKVTKLDKFWQKDIDYDKVKDGFVIPEGLESSIGNIEKAKYLYRKNQNNIYRCGVINSQISVFESIKKTLNSTDKSGEIKERIIRKLDSKKEKLKRISEKECLIINSKKTQIKKVILDQSTIELCNYMYYMKYLDNRTQNNLKDSFPKNKKSISSKEIGKIISEKQSEIEKEKSKSFKLYPLAFDSYIQYDSFLKIHIVLELLKEDYRVFRNKLYLNLHPINQVVYKIINAQSK